MAKLLLPIDWYQTNGLEMVTGIELRLNKNLGQIPSNTGSKNSSDGIAQD